MISSSARLAAFGILFAAGTVLACDQAPKPIRELQFSTDSFKIRVAPESTPTRALETTYWRVVVHDINTGAPIQGGEGRIFATNRDQKTVANGLAETGELGTYRTNLMFVTAGMWAMSMEFRRDSAQRLQRTQDWTQDIRKADEPGDFTTPATVRNESLPPLLPQTKRDSTPPVRKP